MLADKYYNEAIAVNPLDAVTIFKYAGKNQIIIWLNKPLNLISFLGTRKSKVSRRVLSKSKILNTFPTQ
jgi:hypothetical protein